MVFFASFSHISTCNRSIQGRQTYKRQHPTWKRNRASVDHLSVVREWGRHSQCDWSHCYDRRHRPPHIAAAPPWTEPLTWVIHGDYCDPSGFVRSDGPATGWFDRSTLDFFPPCFCDFFLSLCTGVLYTRYPHKNSLGYFGNWR